MNVKSMHAEVIMQNPRTAKISVEEPTAKEMTSVMEVMKMATADSDIASIIRSLRAA
jgi:hypothetical protein